MQFDPAKTLVLAFEYGGFDDRGQARRLLLHDSAQRWIMGLFPGPAHWTQTGEPGIREIRPNVFSVNVEPYLVARNAAIRNCVLPFAEARGLTELLSIDSDVTITQPGMGLFLAESGLDVVCCRCPMPRDETAWPSPQSFHTPLYRAKIDVLRRIEPPWFDFVYTADRCRLLHCDCWHFAEKVKAAGYTIGHAGNCGHGNYGAAWWPGCHVDPDPLSGRVLAPMVTRAMLAEGRLA